MTISSPSASRRYFDRSSVISDRATFFIAFTISRKPGIGVGFRHNRQDLDRYLDHIVKGTNIVTDTKAILGMREPAQSLDAASAHLGWLMPQVLFDGVAHLAPEVRFEFVQVLDSFRGQHDVVSHSGYIIARIAVLD